MDVWNLGTEKWKIPCELEKALTGENITGKTTSFMIPEFNVLEFTLKQKRFLIYKDLEYE